METQLYKSVQVFVENFPKLLKNTDDLLFLLSLAFFLKFKGRLLFLKSKKM
jgi:hypothetical protein